MLKTRALILLIMIPSLMIGCDGKSNGDIVRGGSNYWVKPNEISSINHLGISEQDMLSKVPGKPVRRLSYNPPLPVRTEDGFIPVDRIIAFRGVKLLKKLNKQDDVIIRSSQFHESKVVSVFFYQNKLVRLKVGHIILSDGGSINKHFKLGPDNNYEEFEKRNVSEYWPDAICHKKYYNIVVLQKEPVSLYRSCYWRKDGFQEELQLSGYKNLL